MKKILLFIMLLLGIVSCSHYLDSNPENEVAASEFFKSEKDLEIYTNSFLNSFISDEEEFTFGDQYTDYLATRSSTPFLIGDKWSSEKQGGWSQSKWGELRQINYFLDNMVKIKGLVSDDIYNHYEGVGRFWRAWFYYGMVRTFGDVPWYDHELKASEQDELYKDRDPRQLVMDKVLEDLTFASENCSSDAKFTSSSTRISKWVALAFKSRVCLFEGTYRKYHSELGLQSSSDKFLQESIKASEELMASGVYKIIDNAANKETQYRALFSSDNLLTDEVIFGLDFETVVRMHAVTWKMFSATFGQNWSFSKQFVDQYLYRDGSRFTDQPDYDKIEYYKEFDNRDFRMKQTMITPGYKRLSVNGVEVDHAPNFTMTSTGYQPIKWAIDDDVHIGASTTTNSIPIFRYAEILLNYAEAKAELGEMNESIWNKTIKPLRERAGVNGLIPAMADPYLENYYLNQTADKWILETRRERNIELAFEDVRYDDLMRWKLGDLLSQDWYGIYIPSKDILYDLNKDGKNDVIVVDKKPSTLDKNAIYIVLGTSYKLTDKNLLNFGWAQGRVWSDRMYLRPIPRSAIQVNSNLSQNPGWE